MLKLVRDNWKHLEEREINQSSLTAQQLKDLATYWENETDLRLLEHKELQFHLKSRLIEEQKKRDRIFDIINQGSRAI